MFDVGFTELVLLFVIGLLILGPERLPRVASQLGRWMGKARRTAHQLRMQLEREMTMNDIMRDKKDREQQESEASADAPSDAEYPEDEDANDSGHADAGGDDAGGDDAGADNASADSSGAPADKDTAASDADAPQQRRA